MTEAPAIGAAAAAPRSSPLVAVRAASFAYDVEPPVLRSLSFEIEPGDFVGVVGPNGSGKSTLLDLIDGVLEPVAGDGARQGPADAPVPAPRDRPRGRPRAAALRPRLRPVGARRRRDGRLLPRRRVLAARARRVRRSASSASPSLPSAASPSSRAARSRWSCSPRRSCRDAGVLLLDEPASSLDVSHQLAPVRSAAASSTPTGSP